MFLSKIISIIKTSILIIISLTIIFYIGQFNGFKDRKLIEVEYVDYIVICTWKKDIIGCMEYLKKAEKMEFDFD